MESISNCLHQTPGCARFIFEYASLVKNIPDYIITSCDPDCYPTFDNLKYNVPGKSSPVSVFDLTSKDIYLILAFGNVHERKSEVYWQNKFRDFQIDYNLLYKCLFTSKIIPRKALDFNFRIMNGQVLMEKYLVKMKLSDGKCKCCFENDADVMHLFLHCSYFTVIWSFVKSILTKIGYFNITPFNQVFGFIENNFKHDVANLIVSTARWICWKRHCDIKYKNEIRIHCVKAQYALILKNHINALFLSRNVLNDDTRKQCQIILDNLME